MDGLVRVLEVDPDLGQGLDQQGFAAAKRELVADTLTVARGVWELDPAWSPAPDGQPGGRVADAPRRGSAAR